MAYEQKDNTFSAFKNEKKTTDSHPTLTGSALIDGKQYWVDIWFNVDKNGNRYASGKVKPKEDRAKEIREQAAVDFGDDEIPF